MRKLATEAGFRPTVSEDDILVSRFLERPARPAVTLRVQSDDHHVQANLPAAKTTTHTMRNKNIETAKLACFLNSLRPSLIRVVRAKKIERTNRKIGIAAARKAMILRIILSTCFAALAARFTIANS